METKRIALEAAQIKQVGDGHAFEGYASVFGGLDSYGDTIERGAYSETIQDRLRPIRMFFNHRSFGLNAPATIGKWTEIKEDDTGLFVRGELTQGHPVAEATRASMLHGTVDGLSIGFAIPEGGAEMDGKVRRLKKINLFEISVVEEPADMAARVDASTIKSLPDFEGIRALEDFLRDAGGFSREAAKEFVARSKSICLRDAGGSDEDELWTAFKASLDLVKCQSSMKEFTNGR